MDRRFLLLFAATITLALGAFAASREAMSGAGPLALVALALLGIPALLGLGALVRIVYLDGKAAERSRDARPTGRRP